MLTHRDLLKLNKNYEQVYVNIFTFMSLIFITGSDCFFYGKRAEAEETIDDIKIKAWGTSQDRMNV